MIIVLSTYPDMESAEKAALGLVQNELAACVSMMTIAQSIYRWKGKIESHPEWLLVIKTKKNAYPQLELFIKQTHPHTVPEIVFFEIDGGNKDYLEWVDKNTLSKLLSVPLDFKLTKRAGEPSSELTSARKPSALSR